MTIAARVTQLAAAATLAFGIQTADAALLSFTQLTGTTANVTGVWRADLTGLSVTEIGSVTIADSNSGTGGAGGAFSGFDLDAIVISTVLITDAADVGLLTRAATFDFTSTDLTPGTQRPLVDPYLFGTIFNVLDNAVATLDAFDSDATFSGFVSLGDGGSIRINLSAPLTVSSPLYLYIGEAGDNGEVAAGNITVAPPPVTAVPEPMSLGLFGLGLLGLGLARRRRG